MPLHVAALCGSLRKESFNRKLLNVCIELKPADMNVEVLEIRNLPLYDQDLMDAGGNDATRLFRERCAAAEAFLFVTPEYNYSISGVLKNAIDWASRPPSPPMTAKACAVLGASGGPVGTARAQYHLRQMGVFLDLRFVNKPEVMVGAAQTKFDASGKFTDEAGRGLIKDLMANLAKLAAKLK
ncbi:MAG: NAD(P)H-dependent oxidoreductase [Alphaproteobacteria bacterium]|nr:NAD(P)H-dependent oxidoreductase [Alphaproteobacteria bacterium]